MGEGISLSMETADDVDKVTGFYADGFRAQDWKTDVRRTPEGHTILAEKGDRKASAVVRPRDDGAGAKVDIIVMVN